MSVETALSLSNSTRRTTRTAALALAVASASFAMITPGSALAASGSWTGAATPDKIWATPGNWDTVPGTIGTVNTDIAMFADTTNGNDVTVDLNRNIFGMTFNTTAAVSA